MRAQDTIKAAAAALGQSMDKHLKTRGRSLEDRLRGAKKNLPRKLSKDVEALAAAEKRARYRPDLPVNDPGALARRQAAITAHLDAHDHREERRMARRRWVSDLVINLGILLAAIIVFYMIGTASAP